MQTLRYPRLTPILLIALLATSTPSCKQPAEDSQKQERKAPPPPEIILPDSNRAQPMQKVSVKISNCPEGTLRLLWRDSKGIISSRAITHSSPNVDFDFKKAREQKNSLSLINNKNRRLAQISFYIALPFKSSGIPFTVSHSHLAPQNALLYTTLDATIEKPHTRALLLELNTHKLKAQSNTEITGHFAQKLDEYIKTTDPTRIRAVSLGAGWLGVQRRAPSDGTQFGHHLKQKYKSLYELSRSWNVNVNSWTGALNHKGSIMAELDWAEYTRAQFAELVSGLSELVRKKLPDTLVGMNEPPTTSFLVERFATSGGALDFLTSSSLNSMHQLQTKLLGGDALLIEPPVTTSGVGSQKSPRPASVLTPAQKCLLARAKDIGKIRHKSNRGNRLPRPKLALAYSERASSYSKILTQNSSLPNSMKTQDSYSRAWSGWSKLLGDLNILYQPISIEKLARSALSLDSYRVIIMPHSLLLSPDELTALIKFTRRGGTVIFDAVPTCMPNATRSEAKKLDTFLGLKLKNPRYSELGGGNLLIANTSLKYHHATVESYFASPPRLGLGPACSGLELEGASHNGTFGKTKTLIVNNFDGRDVITLNLAFSGYLNIADTPARSAGVRELIGRLLARLGVTASISGDNNPLIKLRALETNSTTLIIAESSRPLRAPSTIGLSADIKKPSAIYDMLRGEFLKFGRGAKITLPKNSRAIMAMLPYRVEGIEIREIKERTDDISSSHRRFSIQIITDTKAQAQTHFVDINISNPNRPPEQAFQVVTELVGGRGEFTVPFGESKREELWNIRARDGTSGVTALKRFLLKKKK